MLTPLVAIAQLLATGSTAQKPDSTFLKLVPTLVRAAVEDARRSIPAEADQGPLLIDLESFAIHGSMTTDWEISVDNVAATIGQPYRPADRTDAIRCDFQEGSLSPSACSITDDGLHLELQCASRTESGFQALIMYRWTKRPLSRPTMVGVRLLRVWLVPRAGAWQVSNVKVVLTT